MMPFEIDRESWVRQPHQVADGIRRCIVDGVWKPGDKLPVSPSGTRGNLV